MPEDSGAPNLSVVLYHPDLVFLFAQSEEKAELKIAPGTVMKHQVTISRRKFKPDLVA